MIISIILIAFMYFVFATMTKYKLEEAYPEPNKSLQDRQLITFFVIFWPVTIGAKIIEKVFWLKW